MKKIILILSFLLSVSLYADDTVSTRMVVADDPRAGIIYMLCIEDYKFTIYLNSRVVSNTEGYVGESQSSSLTQILDDRGRGIKCSK